MPYAELLDRLIDLAVDRHARRAAARAASAEPPVCAARASDATG